MSIGLCGDPLYYSERACNGCGAKSEYAGKGEGSHDEKKIKLLLDEMDKALGKLRDQIGQRLMINGICPRCGAGKECWSKASYIDTLDKVKRTRAEDMLRAYEWRIGSNKEREAKRCLAVIIKNSKKLTELDKVKVRPTRDEKMRMALEWNRPK